MGSSWEGKTEQQRPVLGGTPARLFTRRHHKYLSETLARTAYEMIDPDNPDAPNHSVAAFVIRGVIEKIASAMRRDNPSFDEEQFVKACLEGWW